MTSSTAFFMRSDVVRPARTADRAMGRDRNRSTMPSFMSSARPMAVLVEPNSAFCTKIPGIRNCTYVRPGGRNEN